MKPILHGLAVLVLLSASARAQTILFQDGFENGLGNWAATGLWHVQTESTPCGMIFAPFPGGDRGAYYGMDSPCDYDTGAPNAGVLTLAAPVFLPASSPRAVIRYWSWRCAEACSVGFDQTTVQVSSNGGASWTTVHSGCPHPKVACDEMWRVWEADISAFIGSSVLVRFSFDTADDFKNQYRGWMIDDVSIRLQAGQPYSGPNCPCNNPPAGSSFITCSCLNGCKNSSGLWGELGGTGFPRVSQDDVQLVARDLAYGATALFLQGSVSSFTILGDGLLGLGNPTIRLGTKLSIGGVARYPEAGDLPISIKGAIQAGGGQRGYQVVYRDSDNYCTPARVNLTNGYRIIWVP